MEEKKDTEVVQRLSIKPSTQKAILNKNGDLLGTETIVTGWSSKNMTALDHINQLKIKELESQIRHLENCASLETSSTMRAALKKKKDELSVLKCRQMA